MEKKLIEETVADRLQQYGYVDSTDDYVDIVAFVQSQGFIVGNAELNENEDGFLAIRPSDTSLLSNQRVIGVNSARNLDFKRFVIAHEYAHSVLHYQEGQVYLHRENKKGKDDKENDADYFAAVLLMPPRAFKRKYDEFVGQGLTAPTINQKLASVFVVPIESVERRIQEVCAESTN